MPAVLTYGRNAHGLSQTTLADELWPVLERKVNDGIERGFLGHPWCGLASARMRRLRPSKLCQWLRYAGLGRDFSPGRIAASAGYRQRGVQPKDRSASWRHVGEELVARPARRLLGALTGARR
jgi:hypothetical protein